MIVAKQNGRSLADGLTYIEGGKGADLIRSFAFQRCNGHLHQQDKIEAVMKLGKKGGDCRLFIIFFQW
jgi:hypothetical protein